MTYDERASEIVRLQNFKIGLEKQVKHYDELLRTLLEEHAIQVAKYKVGSVVLVKIYEYSEYRGKKGARKVVGIGAYISQDYKTEIKYICDRLPAEQYNESIPEKDILELVALPIAEVE